MKLILIPLLLMSVQGVAQEITKIDSLESIKPTTIMRGYGGYWYEDRDTTIFLPDSCDQQKLEIQTLRLLNDSLTKRLKEQIEYRAYASEIIKCLTVRNRMGDIRVYFKDQIGGRIAYLRYCKRYKTN